MTLNTHIRINQPAHPEKIFRMCQTLLGDPGSMIWEHSPNGNEWDDTPRYENQLGQGFPGILVVFYGADGPLDTGEEDEDPKPAGLVEITLDTAYGYRADNDAGCSDLHAWFISQVYEWCKDNGLANGFTWQNEFSGEWSEGTDNLDNFGDIARGRITQ